MDRKTELRPRQEKPISLLLNLPIERACEEEAIIERQRENISNGAQRGREDWQPKSLGRSMGRRNTGGLEKKRGYLTPYGCLGSPYANLVRLTSRRQINDWYQNTPMGESQIDHRL